MSDDFGLGGVVPLRVEMPVDRQVQLDEIRLVNRRTGQIVPFDVAFSGNLDDYVAAPASDAQAVSDAVKSTLADGKGDDSEGILDGRYGQ